MTRQDRANICLVVQHDIVWVWLKFVYRALLAHPHLNVSVLVLSCTFDQKTQDNAALVQQLKEEGVPVWTGESLEPQIDSIDLLVFTSPYDHSRPPFYYAEQLIHRVRYLAYIPYGLEVGGGPHNPRMQYNLPTQNLAWKVFVRSEQAKGMFAKYCDRGDAHVVVTGHPKFDQLADSLAQTTPAALTKKMDGRTCFLWNPHFTFLDGSHDWSTFLDYKDALFDYFRKRQELFLIFRPHPFLNARLLSKGLMDEIGLQTFYDKLVQQDNIWVDTDKNCGIAFKASSALISDTSSFLLEYIPTGKPIIYTHKLGGPGLNKECSPIFDSHYVATNWPELTKHLTVIQHGEDPLKANRMAVGELLNGPEKEPAKRIAEVINTHFIQQDT